MAQVPLVMGEVVFLLVLSGSVLFTALFLLLLRRRVSQLQPPSCLELCHPPSSCSP